MLRRNLQTPIDWEAVFMQMKEQYSRGDRVFVVNRFEDNSTAAVVAHLHSKPVLDVGDGSINPDFAEMLREEFRGSKIARIVTTLANKESQILNRRTARLNGREQGVFIAVEHERIKDDFYAVRVTEAATVKRYTLEFVSECPPAPFQATPT